MRNHKKKRNKLKTENFLNKFSIKILLQHNNLSVKDWLIFKQKIQEITENSVEIFNVKNSLLKKSLLTFTDKEVTQSLCQGPNVILGLNNDNHLKSIWNQVQSHSKLVFISCFYNQKLLNHLDLEIFLKLDCSIYLQFLHTLDKKTELSHILQNKLQFSPLFIAQEKYLSVLQFLKESKQEKQGQQ